MPNPYHDETGRFCSKNEMSAAISRLETGGKVAEAFVLREEMAEIYRRTVIKVGIDLDNTTGDFTDGFRQFIKDSYKLSDEEVTSRLADPNDYEYDVAGWFPDRLEFRRAFREAERNGLYGKMELYHGVAEALQKLVADGKVEIHVVTARDKAWQAETLAWLKSKNLPIVSSSHTEDKALTDMDIYIDDAPHQLENLRAAGKLVIAFNQLYNAHMDPSIPRVNSWAEIPAAVRILSRQKRAQFRKQHLQTQAGAEGAEVFANSGAGPEDDDAETWAIMSGHRRMPSLEEEAALEAY